MKLGKGRCGQVRCCLLLGLTAFLLLSGCTKQVRSAPPVAKKDISLKGLLNLYRDRLETGKGFRALIEVKTRRPRQGGHTFLAHWHSEKDEIRIRGFNLFGGTLFDLQRIGPVFSLTIPAEHKRIEANFNEHDAETNGKIPFGSIDLLEWVQRGGVPMIASPPFPALEKGDDFFILYLFIHDGRRATLLEKIWIERTAFQVKRVELFDPTGLRRGSILLDDYRPVGPRDFPFSITGITGDEKVSLNFKEVFLLGLPPGGKEKKVQ